MWPAGLEFDMLAVPLESVVNTNITWKQARKQLLAWRWGLGRMTCSHFLYFFLSFLQSSVFDFTSFLTFSMGSWQNMRRIHSESSKHFEVSAGNWISLSGPRKTPWVLINAVFVGHFFPCNVVGGNHMQRLLGCFLERLKGPRWAVVGSWKGGQRWRTKSKVLQFISLTALESGAGHFRTYSTSYCPNWNPLFWSLEII